MCIRDSIYIVEDDESIREIETIALKNSNYIVSAFEDVYKRQLKEPPSGRTDVQPPEDMNLQSYCRLKIFFYMHFTH